MALTIPINLNIENIAELNKQVAGLAGAAGGAGAGAAGGGTSRIGAAFGGQSGTGAATAKGLGQIASQLPGAGVFAEMGGAFKKGGLIGVASAGIAGIMGFVKQILESSKVFQGIAGSFFKIFGAMADVFLLPFLPLAMKGMQVLLNKMPMMAEWGQKSADWLEKVFEKVGNFISLIKERGFWEALKETLMPPLWELGNKIMQKLPFGPKEEDYFYNQKTGEVDTRSPEFTRDRLMREAREANQVGEHEGAKYKDDAELQEWAEKRTGLWKDAQRKRREEQLEETRAAATAALTSGADLDTGVVSDSWWGRQKNRFLGSMLQQGTSGYGMGGMQFSPVIKRGDQLGGLGDVEGSVGSIMNSMETSLGRNAEQLANYAIEFKQKEVGSGGVMARWDEDVIRGSIPETWDSISGMYRSMDDELAEEARNAELLRKRGWDPLAMGDFGLGMIGDELTAALSEMTLSDFVLDSSVADEVKNCFILAGQCLEAKFTSISDLVEGGVQKLQLGIGGDIMDLAAVNTLIEAAQAMGGAVEAEANALSADISQLIHEIATGAELTIDPKLISERIIDLQNKTGTKVGSVASSISEATAEVNNIVSGWGSAAGWGSMGIHATAPGSYMTDSNRGSQFGALGAAFGDAATRANDAYWRIKNYKPPVVKRAKQIDPCLGKYQSSDPGGACYDGPAVKSIEDIIDIIDEGGDVGGDEPIDYGPGDDVASGIHVEYDSGGGGEKEWSTAEVAAAVESGALIPEGGLSEARGLDTSSVESSIYGPGDDIDAGIHQAYDSGGGYSSSSGGGGWSSGGGGPGGRGFQFGGYGGRGGVQNIAQSVMNVSINTTASIQDILSDLSRVQHMDDASFFNSVN